MAEESEVINADIVPPEDVGPTGDVQAQETPFVFRKRDSLHFPPTRIKKIMLADNEVGKIKKESPALIALCIEMFIEQLISAAADATQANGARLLAPGHLKRAVLNNPKWDFIHPLVSKLADLPEPSEEAEAPKRQRKKKEVETDENGVAIKKAAAKRAAAPKKPRKKKGQEDSDEIAAAEPEQMAVEDSATAEVFVDVSLAPAASSAPPPVAIVDEDDFDA